MRELLTRWGLALVLALGLAAPLARAEKVESASERPTTTSRHTAEPAEEEPENPGHKGVVSVQAQESAWIIVIFVILLFVLGKTAWKPVLDGLKARENRIRKDISDAEAARTQAESSLREYQAQLSTAEQKVRDMISNATAEGERIATTIRMQAQQESEAIKERAVKEIESARKQALQEIYTRTAELSTSIAEKILRRNLNADDQRDLVNQGLEQFQNA